MIDAHCHLNFHKFESDYDAVITRALEKGVSRIINTGTKLDSSQAAIDLAEKYNELYAIVGVHPHHADKLELNEEANAVILGTTQSESVEDSRIPPSLTASEGHGDSGRASLARMTNDAWIKALENMTKHPKVVGIGECGLDYYSYQSNGIVDPKVQKEVFEAQIELSYRSGLPLQIHNRQAGEDVIAILKQHKNLLQAVPGMFHCFAGSEQVLKDALDLGFYIGFDGNLTYDGIAKGEITDLKDIARLTPVDRIVVETDSPYLTPAAHRGKRNEPQYVIIVAQFIAQLKGISYQKLVEQTDKNVYTVFNKLQ